jgi:hypothetical protein
MTPPTVVLLWNVFVAKEIRLPSRCLATTGGYILRYVDRSKEFLKHAVEMGSGAMIFFPSFIKIGLGIQKFIGVEFTDTQTAM